MTNNARESLRGLPSSSSSENEEELGVEEAIEATARSSNKRGIIWK